MINALKGKKENDAVKTHHLIYFNQLCVIREIIKILINYFIYDKIYVY